MLPVFTIVGRPNVGKSTLFNYLTKTRDAIVGDTPGITRDRHYGEASCDDRDFIIVDTGGIAESDDPDMAEMTEKQVDLAIQESDVVLFIVDAKAGITNGDQAIAKQLRPLTHKKIILVVNKADRELAGVASSEFHALGLKQLFVISATSGRGVNDMLTQLLAYFPIKKNIDVDDSADEEKRTRIAILGRPNVGKSTLINRLLGEERVLVLDRPGTTRDSIAIPFDHHDKKYTLIDTAGIRRRGKIVEDIEIFSVIKAMQAMKAADVVILVIDAREGVTDQDMRLLGLILQTGNALVLAFNKWDHMNEEERDQFKAAVDRKLPFANFARHYFISAKHGTGVGKLYEAIDETQNALKQGFSTPELTRLIMSAAETHQPPLSKGRRVKLRYAHLGSRKPLLIVIHGKQVEGLVSSYKQFLVSYVRKALRLTGIPLMIKCVSDDNPYVDKE